MNGVAVKTGTKTLAEIRSEACNDILVVSSVLVFLAVIGSIARTLQQGWHPVSCCTSAYWRRLSSQRCYGVD